MFLFLTQYVCACFIQLLSGALRMSLLPLAIALFLAMVGALFFGALVYFVERGEWNDEARAYFNEAGKRR